MSTARITNSTQTGISLKEMVSHLFMGRLFYRLKPYLSFRKRVRERVRVRETG